MPRTSKPAIVPVEYVQEQILTLRGQRVILAADLARLYAVTTKRLNEAVKRNAERFPADFMFQLTKQETEILRLQSATLKSPSPNSPLRSQIATSNLKSQIATSSWGGARRALPYAFTEHGAIMAATVLNSPAAVHASLFVVRAFVKLRELLATHHQLAEKLDQLERKLQNHDGQILSIVDAIRQLMDADDVGDPPKPPVGFHTEIAPRSTANAKRKKLHAARA